MNILITQGSSYKAISISKFLKNHYPNFKIISLMEKTRIFKIHSKYFDVVYYIGRIEDEIISLNEIIKMEKIDIIIPIKNSEMEFWLSSKDAFNDQLYYWGDLENFNKLNDKSSLYRIAKALNINIPKLYSWNDEILSKIVIKPRNLSSSKGVRYVTNKKAMLKLQKSFSNLSNYIIQEYIEGEGIGFSCFCKNGKIILGYGHKRLAEYPISGGSSVYRTNHFDERAVKIAEQLNNCDQMVGVRNGRI